MVIIQGIAASGGIAIAPAAWLRAPEAREAVCTLDEAVRRALQELEQSRQAAEDRGASESLEILEAYRTLLTDEVMLDEIRAEQEAGNDICSAVKAVLSGYAAMFANMDNDYMRQRAEDVRNVGSILCRHLTGGTDAPGLESLTGILAARELTPLDTVRLDKSRIAGFLTELGGATSHIAILAKSLGIPAVVGLTGLMDRLECFEEPPLVILDGEKGVAYLDPDIQTLQDFRRRQAAWEKQKRLLSQEAQTEGYTADGTRITICVNIGGPEDLDAVPGRYDGVGLFRTEFLFSSLDHEPDFHEQYALYRAVVEKNGDNWTTFRTLDVGGDKGIPYLEIPREENPFLGNRGIRLCLERENVFLTQLMAILAAGAGHRVKLMFPMVSQVEELLAARQFVQVAQERLREEGIPQCGELKLGVMIETPAAALTADILLEVCDFVSLGTNDLTQYIMAADRNNTTVASLCDACDPAVIRGIRYVAQTGAGLGKPVSVCGELAGTEAFIPLLIGMGIRHLSVSPGLVLQVRHQVRNLTLGKTQALAEDIAKARCSADVRVRLEIFQKEQKEDDHDFT